MTSKSFLIVGPRRYAYNGESYVEGDRIEIDDADIGGFEEEDLKAIRTRKPKEMQADDSITESRL